MLLKVGGRVRQFVASVVRAPGRYHPPGPLGGGCLSGGFHAPWGCGVAVLVMAVSLEWLMVERVGPWVCI